MRCTFRHGLLYISRKAGRYKNVLAVCACVFIFLRLHATILSRSTFHNRRTSAGILSLKLTSGDGTTVGAKAYARGWVGFSEMAARVNCSMALSQPTRNFRYPQTVTRISADDISSQCQQSCETFRNDYGFERYPQATEEEREFPIAFIILFHKDLDQVLFLLRAIYRPHNVYCLSVDLNSGPAFLAAVSAVSGCLRNVFVASKLEHIVYSGFSRLMADLHCMEDLSRHNINWKYVINMPGQQFPLKTNLEMVRILKLYNGANDVMGEPASKALHRRYKFRHHVIIDPDTGLPAMASTMRPKPPPPHGFRLVKGSAYVTLSRDFVRFALRHPWAQDLVTWSRDIESPDEYVWGTLHHAQHMVVPGGYTGVPHDKPWLTSYTTWQGQSRCASTFVRWICIFSPADLPRLVVQPHFFANKFYLDRGPAALHCLDQYLYNLTVSGTVRGLDFYARLPFLLPLDDFGQEWAV